MKLNKSLLIAALGLGFAGAAHAACTAATATHIYITGSTAFRGASIAAIEASLNPGFNYAAYKESASFTPYATARQTAGYVNYYGTLAADSSCVVIKCAWSGSEAGYVDMVKCSTQKEGFMDDTVGGFGVTSIDSTGAAPNTADSHGVDIAMADNSQPFAKPASRSPVIANISKAGIIPFVWVKNAQTAADIAANPDYNDLVNVTHPQLRVAIQNGSKLSLFTGKPGQNKWVYVAGRDNNSGTRANTLLDIGFPVVQTVNQTIIGGANGAPTLAQLGNGGQASGGTLGNTMLYTGSAVAADTINTGNTGWYAIAYMGKPDAITRELPLYTV
ncbi:MAG: hypothetical protein NT154_04555, partial [Verrucomicrobia bacterium]|nr:hypothetical protein [Verrucomicrobiota bacterium]